MELDPKYADVIVRHWQEFASSAVRSLRGSAARRFPLLHPVLSPTQFLVLPKKRLGGANMAEESIKRQWRPKNTPLPLFRG
jgi:hypothetical protein